MVSNPIVSIYFLKKKITGVKIGNQKFDGASMRLKTVLALYNTIGVFNYLLLLRYKTTSTRVLN